ncbi:hypothetical protein EJB05_11947, partial [Eragrostis curvula]
MASPFRRKLESPASPRQLSALSDDLLEEIFLRIACPADIARASTACVAFHRLITDRTFLRCYCSRYPPLLLGFLTLDVAEGFRCAEAPHPNAAAAGALVRAAAGFSFDYLPRGKGHRWDPCDVHDGRVLLKCLPPDGASGVVPDLVVCDPLSRLYLMLPALPEEEEHGMKSFDAVFAPCTDAEETSFRVMGMAFCETKIMIFDFSSTSGCWMAGASSNWGALIPKAVHGITQPCYAYGCFYFKVRGTTKLLKLDMNTMDFSILNLPDACRGNIVTVEAGKGRLGMFCRNRHGKYLEYYTIMQSESEKASKWQKENRIAMWANYECFIAGEAEGYVFIVDAPRAALPPKVQDTELAVCISIQIKTGKIQRVSRYADHCAEKKNKAASPAMLSRTGDGPSAGRGGRRAPCSTYGERGWLTAMAELTAAV